MYSELDNTDDAACLFEFVFSYADIRFILEKNHSKFLERLSDS